MLKHIITKLLKSTNKEKNPEQKEMTHSHKRTPVLLRLDSHLKPQKPKRSGILQALGGEEQLSLKST
jgi:hypothetical protein